MYAYTSTDVTINISIKKYDLLSINSLSIIIVLLEGYKLIRKVKNEEIIRVPINKEYFSIKC